MSEFAASTIASSLPDSELLRREGSVPVAALRPSLVAAAMRGQRPVALAIAAVLAFAIGVRFVDLGGRSISHDEAWRANWSLGDDMGKARRMPPLQYLAHRWIQQLGGRNEWALRAPYALAGVACCVALTVLAWRLFDPLTALCVACIAAGHPALALYSRFVKVFSLTSMAAAILMLLGYRAVSNPDRRSLVTFTIVAVPCILMSFGAVLIVAAWGLLLAWTIVRSRRRPKHAGSITPAVAFGCAAVIGVVVAFWYVWLSGSTLLDTVYTYNRVTFNPWPAGHSLPDLARWSMSACFGAYRFVIGAEDVWAPLKWIIWTAATVAMLAGWSEVWRRARPLCAFALLLLAVALVLGASGYWPLSSQPTSMYLIPITVVLMGGGLAWLYRRLGRSVVFAFLLALLTLVPAARAARRSWPGVSLPEHIRPVLDYVRDHKSAADGVFVYYSDEEAFRFYWRDATTPVLFQPGDDRGQPEVFAERFESFVREHGRAWFVAAHTWRNELDDYLTSLPPTLISRDGVATASSIARLYEIQVETDGHDVPRPRP